MRARIVPVLLLLALPGTAGATPWRLPAPGEVSARVAVESDLSRHRVMQPLSIAPDLIVGVATDHAVAWHHSRAFDARLGAGSGMCLVGSRETLGAAPAPCTSRYAGGGVSLLRRLTRRTLARAGIVLVDTKPPKLAVSGGVVARLVSGRWWGVAAPTVVVGIQNRSAGNRDRLQVPLYAGATLGRGELHVRTGFDATAQTLADTFAVPIGAGGSVSIRRVRVGATVMFDKAFGPLNSMAWRSAVVFVEVSRGARS